MDRETAQLDREIKVAEQSYGPGHLCLVLARGYVTRLISKTQIARWLQQHQAEVLAKLRKIAEADTTAA